MLVEINSVQECAVVVADARALERLKVPHLVTYAPHGLCLLAVGTAISVRRHRKPDYCTDPEAPLRSAIPTGRENLLFHTMVGSNDIERSKKFYNAVLGALGAGEATLNVAGSGHSRLFYRNEGGTNFVVSQPINDEPATVANGSTVAFSCNSPEQVRKFHDVAIANGGTSIEDLPGPRETGMGTIHLAYVRDPDGNKLCGIHIPR